MSDIKHEEDELIWIEVGAYISPKMEVCPFCLHENYRHISRDFERTYKCLDVKCRCCIENN